MGIYSTDNTMTKEKAIEIIKDRISRIEEMSDPRIVEILEACVQVRDYDEQFDVYAYNNFWRTFE